MKRSEKRLFIFVILGATLSYFVDILAASRLEQWVFGIGFMVFYWCYEIMERLFAMKTKQDALFDLLWSMSFKSGIDDCERDDIKEQLKRISSLEK